MGRARGVGCTAALARNLNPKSASLWSLGCRAGAALADELHQHLSTDDAQARIADANQPGRSSAVVQATFGEFVRDLGLESEKVGLFGTDELALRPDYFLRLEGTGILLEVERGKITPLALRQNPDMSPRKELVTVTRRMERFFVPGNYTNVRGLRLFGY
jgi:hypothetical protein